MNTFNHGCLLGLIDEGDFVPSVGYKQLLMMGYNCVVCVVDLNSDGFYL